MSHYHEVRQGECMASLAKSYGFEDAGRLCDHPHDAGLKRRRPNPYVLFPGDRVFIPAIGLGEADAETERRHVYEVVTAPVYLRLPIEDLDGGPCRLKRYELRLARKIIAGLTDESGFIKQRIGAWAGTTELIVWLDDDESRFYRWNLRIGHLDRVEQTTRATSRIRRPETHGFRRPSGT